MPSRRPERDRFRNQLIVQRQQASGNQSTQGGAIDLIQVTQATVSNSIFTGNQAVVPSSTPYLGADASGGAININNGTLAVSGSIFFENEAVAGIGQGKPRRGAIADFFNQSSLTISSSALLNNLAIRRWLIGRRQSNGGSAFGGGLDDSGSVSSTVTIGGTSFIGNQAIGGAGSSGSLGGDGQGGGIYYDATSTLNVTGSLLLANEWPSAVLVAATVTAVVFTRWARRPLSTA